MVLRSGMLLFIGNSCRLSFLYSLLYNHSLGITNMYIMMQLNSFLCQRLYFLATLPCVASRNLLVVSHNDMGCVLDGHGRTRLLWTSII